MSKVIALAGKGGVGKSTIATQIIRALSKKDVILAIDADPNSNLPEKLGIEVEGTIGDMRNSSVEDPDNIPVGMSRHEYMAMSVRRLISETDKVDMLVMGRPEGVGCYCFTNNVLKECFEDIIPKYRYTVIDNEAGMEHLSRKVIPFADTLLIVSDPTLIGIKTAARLKELAKDVKISVKKTILVINNVTSGVSVLIEESRSLGFDATVTIPHDDLISKAAIQSTELNIPEDSEFGRAIKELISVL